MGGDKTRPMWLLILLLAAAGARAICPSSCRCNEDSLRVSCAGGALEVVPIQLNPEVRHIDLSDNKITSVHFTLGFYDKLLTLDLSTNSIKSLGSGNFEAQRNMKHFNLSHNQVETLSKDSFKGLRALSTLDLSYNHLEEIGEHTFRDLHSIEVLKLTGNQLVFMESGLLKPATMLRELYLEDNQFLDIASTAIGDAYNLQRLFLSGNLIAGVNEGDMPMLPDLQVLRLDGNVISEVHGAALSGLSALEYLDLSNNNFTSVPTVSLAKLSNLTRLRFSGNFISTVPPVAFRGLFQLRFLSLDRLDFLTSIDSRAFVDNINLEVVHMDDNIAISILPHRLFYGNPRITHISVRNNQIAALDASHFPLDQLTRLSVGGNPLQCNCSLLWLWRLVNEQKSHAGNWSASGGELVIDAEDVVCAGPEPLAGSLLADTTESQVGCSLGWIAVAGGIVFTCLLLAAAFTLVYCGPKRKRLKNPELPPIEPIACPNGQVISHPYEYHTYEDPRSDKFTIGPPIIHEYRALPTWDPYVKQCNDVYRQFDNGNNVHNGHNGVKSRPHIVYV